MRQMTRIASLQAAGVLWAVMSLVFVCCSSSRTSENASAATATATATGAHVELQPLAAQVKRVLEALDYIGAPLAAEDRRAIEAAMQDSDPARATPTIARVLDRYVLLDVHINPESRVHVTQGAAKPELVQNGWRTFLVKVTNEAGVTAPLQVESPQGQKVFS